MKVFQLVAALAATMFMSAAVAKDHDSSKVKDDAGSVPVYEYVL